MKQRVRARYAVYLLIAVLGVLALLARWRATDPDEADEGAVIVPCFGVGLLAVAALGSLIEAFTNRRKPKGPDDATRE